MHELEEPRVGARGTKLLDQSVGNSAAAVHCKSGRLVDGQDCIVLVKNGRF